MRAAAVALPLVYCLELALVVSIVNEFFVFDWRASWAYYERRRCIYAWPMWRFIFGVPTLIFGWWAMKVTLGLGYKFLRRPIHLILSAR